MHWQLASSIDPAGNIIQTCVRTHFTEINGNLTEIGSDLVYSLHPILPDIALDQSSIKIVPAMPNPGDSVSIETEIINIGDISARNFNVSIFDTSENTLVNKIFPSIYQNTSTQLFFLDYTSRW
jgi:hypothetical protein